MRKRRTKKSKDDLSCGAFLHELSNGFFRTLSKASLTFSLLRNGVRTA